MSACCASRAGGCRLMNLSAPVAHTLTQRRNVDLGGRRAILAVKGGDPSSNKKVTAVCCIACVRGLLGVLTLTGWESCCRSLPWRDAHCAARHLSWPVNRPLIEPSHATGVHGGPQHGGHHACRH